MNLVERVDTMYYPARLVKSFHFPQKTSRVFFYGQEMLVDVADFILKERPEEDAAAFL